MLKVTTLRKFTNNHFIYSKSVFLKLYPTETSVCDNQFRAKNGTNIDTLLKNNMLVVEVIFYWEVFS
jgi:hypothetical protein